MLKAEGCQSTRTATWIQILIPREPGYVAARTLGAGAGRLPTTAPRLSARSAQDPAPGRSALSTVTLRTQRGSPSRGPRRPRPGLLHQPSPCCAALLLLVLFSLRNFKNLQYKHHEMPQFLLQLSYLPASFLINRKHPYKTKSPLIL